LKNRNRAAGVSERVLAQRRVAFDKHCRCASTRSLTLAAQMQL
jgi:hypothetical protein